MPELESSRYNVFVPLRHGRTLAYNSLSGAFALWEAEDREAYERLRQGEPAAADGDVGELLRGGYLVPEGTDELALLEQEYVRHRFDDTTLILTLAPTLACNFGCDYCFQGQDKPVDVMSPEVQDAIVAFCERAAPRLRHLHVAWYGGEPLLKPRLVESLSDRLIDVCAQSGTRYDAMIVTNGYNLTADVARALYRRGVHAAQVTLDGEPEYHDRRRALLSGRPTFERISNHLREVVDAVPMTISIRINIDHRNREQIHGLIDLLAAKGLGDRASFKMYFAPVEAMTRGCHVVEDFCMSKADYGDLEAELFRYAFEKGLAVLPYPPRFHGVCTAVRPMGFVITPTGDVHKCWDTVSFPRHAVGTVFDMDAVECHPKVSRWLAWTPFRNDTCRNCKILPNCAGACAYKFVHSEETRGEAAVLPCPSWKYNIKERLLLRAEKMGVITAEDYDADAVRTRPEEICAEVRLDGGEELPAGMQALLGRRAEARPALTVLT